MRTADLCLERSNIPPVSGAAGYVGYCIEGALRDCGYTIRHRHFAFEPTTTLEDRWMPLARASQRAVIASDTPAALRFFDDAGLSAGALPADRTGRNVLFTHGFMQSAGIWQGNPLIDAYWGNSGYAADVIRTMLYFPDFETRRCLDPRAGHIVHSVTPSVSAVEFPDGFPGMTGADLPPEVEAVLASGDVLGHAIQPGKWHLVAVIATTMQLNALLQERGDARRFRLFIATEEFEQLCTPIWYEPLSAELARMGRRFEDVFVPVPWLYQPALFRLFRACTLGLSYIRYPEPFGCYVPESVMNGCPVYTNGSGNNRHLLPPEHGVNVWETEAMAFGDPLAFRDLAERILTETVFGDKAARDCARGAEFIRQHYNRARITGDVRSGLERLERPGPSADLDFDALRIQPSPLVRSWDRETGAVVCDYRSTMLDDEANAIARAIDGERIGDVLDRMQGPVRGAVLALFEAGILTLRPATR